MNIFSILHMKTKNFPFQGLDCIASVSTRVAREALRLQQSKMKLRRLCLTNLDVVDFHFFFVSLSDAQGSWRAFLPIKKQENVPSVLKSNNVLEWFQSIADHFYNIITLGSLRFYDSHPNISIPDIHIAKDFFNCITVMFTY